MRVIGTEFMKEWCLSAGKGGKMADQGRKEDTLEIAVFEVVFGRYCEGCESKKVEIPVTYARVGLKPQSVIRPQQCQSKLIRSLPAIFHYLVGILLLVRSRRSPLRLQTHNQPSAQQSNEICSESNDRLGFNLNQSLDRNSASRN